MRTWIVVAVLTLSSLAAAQPQKPRDNHDVQDVDFCALVHSPQKYSGHMIRVRGHVVFEFEDFTLEQSGCGASSHTDNRGVWLTFGGDEPEVATFCCGSIHRAKGTDLEVVGHRVGLVRDASFHTFVDQISARRLRRPDGRDCNDECKLYKVTATLTGLFAEATQKGGYGHFGMFHLLAIRQVEQISAERTQIPFGGTYECQQEKWEPASDITPSLADSLKCRTNTDCDAYQRFKSAAAHWGDHIGHGFQTELYTDTNADFVANWVSSDLLTTYLTRTSLEGDVTVVRERCRLPVNSRSSASSRASIACRSYDRELGDQEKIEDLLAKDDFASSWAKIATSAKRLYAEGDQSWRTGDAKAAAWYVVQEQAQQWQVALSPFLQFDQCQDASTDESPIFMGCSWYSQDGTQRLSVTLFKPRLPAAEQEQSPWLVTQVHAEACR